MKYLSNAVNFSIKNWMLILPVFVLTAIVSLINIAGTAGISAITSMLNPSILSDPKAMLTLITGMIGSVAGAGLISLIATLIYAPATYGLVNKSLETGSAGLNDLGAAISNNFVKYIMYVVGIIVLMVAGGLAFCLVELLLGLLFGLLGVLGSVLMVIITLAISILIIAVYILLSLWFAAMVVDGLPIMDAAKKSIEIVKGCFWTVLGISLLIWLLFLIAGFVLGLLRVIPLLGPIIYSAVPAGQFFLTAVFYLMVYRDKTGRPSAA